MPDYGENNILAFVYVSFAFLGGVGVGRMIRRAMNLKHVPLLMESVHIVSLVVVASGMGPLVVCRMHDFWGLLLPLGLILEQALILELGVPPVWYALARYAQGRMTENRSGKDGETRRKQESIHCPAIHSHRRQGVGGTPRSGEPTEDGWGGDKETRENASGTITENAASVCKLVLLDDYGELTAEITPLPRKSSARKCVVLDRGSVSQAWLRAIRMPVKPSALPGLAERLPSPPGAGAGCGRSMAHRASRRDDVELHDVNGRERLVLAVWRWFRSGSLSDTGTADRAARPTSIDERLRPASTWAT